MGLLVDLSKLGTTLHSQTVQAPSSMSEREAKYEDPLRTLLPLDICCARELFFEPLRTRLFYPRSGNP
jgi:hypothetical protein